MKIDMPLRGVSLPKIIILAKVGNICHRHSNHMRTTQTRLNLTLTFKMALGFAKLLHDLKASFTFKFQ